ncbi:hypothetical protein QBC47DRAFT_364657 [Echria macrotheca]|uniref:Secreted protein n=1 Tax=Echria macrotheca TaxID=438768 RepID=A0AAJ0B814_9PEZI|nr:hypothetical protein QBC47DRAFT_364657 [Echria macrotheca]
MKVSSVLILAAGVYRAGAVLAGPGATICIAACAPLLLNPIAYAACLAGCAALEGPDGGEAHKSPRFLPDGTVVFEKESDQCAEVCKPLVNEPLTYSACLGGCAGATERQKK